MPKVWTREKKKNPRGETVATALTTAEKREVEDLAKATNQTISDLVRDRVVGYPELASFASQVVRVLINLTEGWQKACQDNNMPAAEAIEQMIGEAISGLNQVVAAQAKVHGLERRVKDASDTLSRMRRIAQGKEV